VDVWIERDSRALVAHAIPRPRWPVRECHGAGAGPQRGFARELVTRSTVRCSWRFLPRCCASRRSRRRTLLGGQRVIPEKGLRVALPPPCQPAQRAGRHASAANTGRGPARHMSLGLPGRGGQEYARTLPFRTRVPTM